MRDKITILKGNESRREVDSEFKIDYDVQVLVGSSKSFFYHVSNDIVHPICPPIFFKNSQPITWEALNSRVKIAYWKETSENGAEFDDEAMIFVYGDETGDLGVAKANWAKQNEVLDFETTIKLADELGYFNKVDLKRSINYITSDYQLFFYVIDEKWFVKVSTKLFNGKYACTTYDVQDYAKVRAEEKHYGRRVSKFIQKADVPWEIAKLAGHIASDKEAVKILKNVKAAREKVDEQTRHDLTSGMSKRTATIYRLLGENYSKLDCRDAKSLKALASYLIYG